MLHRLFMVFALLFFFTASARAQDFHEWEIFAGGDYLNANACPLAHELTGNQSTCSVPLGNGQSTSFSQNAYGWHLTLAENKMSWLGGVMDFSGDYANRTINFGTSASPVNIGFNGSAYPFLFGPRFYMRRLGRVTLFGSPLIGGVHVRATIPSAASLPQPVCAGCPSLPVSETKWAFAVGGGFDYEMTDRISIRAQGDWIRSHFPETLAVDYQNIYRISAGLVFKFGGR